MNVVRKAARISGPGFLVLLLLISSPAWAADTHVIAYEPQGAQRAEIALRPAVARLHLSAHEDAEALVEGTVTTGASEELEQSFSVAGDLAVLRLASVRRFPFISFNENLSWELRLNPQIPLELSVEAGVGRAELELTDLNLVALTLSTGVGESRITLPAEGRFEVRVRSGVGATTIRIPRGLAARIRVSAGLGSTHVLGDYRRQDGLYLSPDYDGAEHRVDLEVEAGIGEVTIEPLDTVQ